MSRLQPRRLLMTTDAVGGVWTYACDLAAGLAGRGVEVTLAVLGPSPTTAQVAAIAASDGVELVDTGLPLDWIADDDREVVRAAKGVAQLAAERRADLVHLNTPALAADARFTAPVVGACHSCLATWWQAVRGGDMPSGFERRTERLARAYRACDRLVAPSYAFMQDTVACYGVLPAVVRNGRSTGVRRAGQPKSPLAITSGRLWDEGKNLTALDSAAALMWNPLHAAGPLEGPNGEVVRPKAVAPLGVLDTDALSARLNQAAVFTSLALYEPFGLGVLEAAQAGCALVLSDIPTFRELWQGAAVFVPPGQQEAVALILDGLISDARACSRMGALAQARAAQYGVEAMVEGMLGVYGDALAVEQGRAA